MKLACTVAVAALILTLAGTALAKDTGAFVVMLGTDTTGVESYVRSGDRLEVDQLGRAPRTLRRKFVFEMKNDVVSHFTMVVTPPGATEPTQTIDGRVDGDTLRTDIKSGPAPVINQRVAIPKGALIVPGSSPWAHYESLTMKLAKSKADSVGISYIFVGGNSANWITASRLGRDSMALHTSHDDAYHVRVDKSGRLLGVLPISGTQKFGVTRLASIDMEAYAASFAAREKASGAMGQLSPRDTVRASVGGANLALDYSRPTKRGRVVFGNVVPWNEVWRTGANSATQLRTDKDLVIGGQTVPAGFYTVWTLPTATGWKLMINSQTGQWGTEHDASKDLFTFDMQVKTLGAVVEKFTIAIEPSEGGGVLTMSWDTTQASLAFTIKS